MEGDLTRLTTLRGRTMWQKQLVPNYSQPMSYGVLLVQTGTPVMTVTNYPNALGWLIEGCPDGPFDGMPPILEYLGEFAFHLAGYLIDRYETYDRRPR